MHFPFASRIWAPGEVSAGLRAALMSLSLAGRLQRLRWCGAHPDLPKTEIPSLAFTWLHQYCRNLITFETFSSVLILIWPTGLKDIEKGGIYTPAHADTHRAPPIISLGWQLRLSDGFGRDFRGQIQAKRGCAVGGEPPPPSRNDSSAPPKFKLILKSSWVAPSPTAVPSAGVLAQDPEEYNDVAGFSL